MELCFFFFSEEKWLDDKTQALTAVTNHVERLKTERENLSVQRCYACSFVFVSSSVLIHLHFTIKPFFFKMRFVKSYKVFLNDKKNIYLK